MMISLWLSRFMEALAEYLWYLPFLAALLAAAWFAHKRRGIRVPPLHIALCLLFTLYLTTVFNITGALSLTDLQHFGFTFGPVSLRPFSDVRSFGFIMNAVMFLPLGFAVPALFAGKSSLRATALSGFLFSLFIECSQLFNLRATDIDDLVSNTLGAVLGWALFKLLLGRKPRPALQISGSTAYSRHEPLILIAAVFLLRFFLSPLRFSLL